MTTVFLAGSGLFGLNAAERLVAEGHIVVGAVSPAAGRVSSHDALSVWAKRHGIPWSDVSLLAPDAVPAETDIIITAHSHAFIGAKTRARAKYAVGYHPSLLPLHRGRDAVKWQARLGERTVGGTIYHLTNRVDGGPIALQQHIIIPEHTDHRTLWRNHLAPLGLNLIAETANNIAHGHQLPTHPQNDTLATWEPALNTQPLHRPELLEIEQRITKNDTTRTAQRSEFL